MNNGFAGSEGDNSLPVVEVTVTLDGLGAKVGHVTSEEEVVLGSDGERVAHEGGSVDEQAAGHGTGDAAEKSQSQRDGTKGSRAIGRERYKPNSSGMERTSRDPSACPSQRRREYRSWRRGPRSLRRIDVSSYSTKQLSID